ncbi:hypothetical protein [Sorangium sp. So ce854]|uniref:hypothetical protein n=1 Tax=Sorangium sp. So ce854 TaxID=3133322 RepID=UPI003F633022
MPRFYPEPVARNGEAGRREEATQETVMRAASSQHIASRTDAAGLPLDLER